MNKDAGKYYVGKHVLIVDADHPTRKILRATIALKFDDLFKVRETSSGEEAIEMMVELPADIIISDINPEYTSGIEIAQIVQDPYNGWPDTRFILTSGGEGKKACELVDLAVKAWNLGIEFFCKPLDIAMMLKTMKRKKQKPTV